MRERKRLSAIERSLDKSLEQWASVIIETLLSCGATGHKPVAWKICAPQKKKKNKRNKNKIFAENFFFRICQPKNPGEPFHLTRTHTITHTHTYLHLPHKICIDTRTYTITETLDFLLARNILNNKFFACRNLLQVLFIPFSYFTT